MFYHSNREANQNNLDLGEAETGDGPGQLSVICFKGRQEKLAGHVRGPEVSPSVVKQQEQLTYAVFTSPGSFRPSQSFELPACAALILVSLRFLSGWANQQHISPSLSERSLFLLYLGREISQGTRLHITVLLMVVFSQHFKHPFHSLLMSLLVLILLIPHLHGPTVWFPVLSCWSYHLFLCQMYVSFLSLLLISLSHLGTPLAVAPQSILFLQSLSILVCLLLLWWNTNPDQLGEKGVYLPFTSGSQSVTEGSRGARSTQELQRGPWRGAVYRLALHSLLSLLS